MPTVTALQLVPVKGMAALDVPRIEITAHGVTGDRAFSVLDRQGGVHTARAAGALPAVRPRVSDDGEELELAFPGGELVRGPVVLGEPAEGVYLGTRFAGRLVEGPFAAALERHLGAPAALLRHDAGRHGWDQEPVSLVGSASLDELARHAGRDAVDRRRFRMAIEVGGIEAHEEDGWVGLQVAVGSAVLEVVERCERCVITTRDPDSGRVDFQALKVLAGYRGKRDVCMGVLCRVIVAGRVAVGDAVSVCASDRGASGGA